VALNSAARELKRGGRLAPLDRVDEAGVPAEPDAVWEMLQSLSPGQRAAIYLHYQEDLPVRDVPRELLAFAEAARVASGSSRYARTVRRRGVLSIVLVAVLAATATPVGARMPGRRYAIGDSVMVAAKDELSHRGIVVNAVKSRQFSAAVPIVRKKAADGSLRRKVIIHLGTNKVIIQASDCDKISKAATKRRHVYLVTITGPTRATRKVQNTRLRACAQRHRNTSLLDWYGHSRGHTGWFYDRIHLTPKGQNSYGAYLDNRTS
jgi:hypothetical protein